MDFTIGYKKNEKKNKQMENLNIYSRKGRVGKSWLS